MKNIILIILIVMCMKSSAQQISPGTKTGDTTIYVGFSRFSSIASGTDTNTLKPMGIAANGLASRMTYWPSAGGGSGVTTMQAFGAVPNANGASISGVNLTLQPADGTNPGSVSTTTQTFPGAKTFSSAMTSSVSTTTPILIGGTGVASSLQIRPTSGVGSTGADIIIQNANNGATEIARIMGSNGRTGFGTASPVMLFDITNGTQVTGSNSNNPTVLNVTGVNNSITGGGATMYINSNSAMAADAGGSLGFAGLLTTGSNSSNQLYGIIKGAKVNGTTNNFDGYLDFGVYNHNVGALQAKMRLTGNTLNLNGNSSQAAELRFYEDTDDGTNYTSWKVGTQAANLDYTWPTAYPGGTGYALTSTTAGVTSWGTSINVASSGTEGIKFGTTLRMFDDAAKLAISPSAGLLQVRFDASNYYNTTVGSTGSVTHDAVGAGSAFTFSDAITVPALTATGAISLTAGADKSVGQATLVVGTVTVNNTRVTASSLIFFTVATPGGIQGFLSVGTISAGTSFIINSTNAAETSTVNWMIIN